MKIDAKFFCLIFFIFFTSCSGVKVITPENTGLYDEKFLQKIDEVKVIYKKGDLTSSLKKLEEINDKNLTTPEVALKYNFVGVINFSLKKYNEAKTSFETALKLVASDVTLNSQIYLNLASTEYKLGNNVAAEAALVKVNSDALVDHEKNKFNTLGATLGILNKNPRLATNSYINLLSEKKDLHQLNADTQYKKLEEQFFVLSDSEKAEILKIYEDKNFLCVGLLAFKLVEKNFLSYGGKDVEKNVDWIIDNFSEYTELVELAERFKKKTATLANMDSSAIGVILPFSGDKSEFSKRTMLGIEYGLKELFSSSAEKVLQGTAIPTPIIYTQDSKGDPITGGNGVEQLINEHSVSVIIGGLFSDEASKEYIEAKKHGVFFISLSEVLLPHSEKDYLLLEIPGSVESQVSMLMGDEIAGRFGKRGAILYPKTDRGEAFTSEFWREAKDKNIEVTGTQSYERTSTDFRAPIQELLGLRYRRERQEEFDLWSKVYALENTGSMRRIQTLPPKIDFDWIFIPAYPQEARQIVPLFTYFDVFDLPIVGGPSWRSQSVANMTERSGFFYFLGDEIKEGIQEDFNRKFYDIYKKVPRLIETMGFEALKIIAEIFKYKISDREQLNEHIKTVARLEGITGNWVLSYEGVWLKKMSALKIKGGKIQKIEGINK